MRDADGLDWTRQGSCNGCGACCQGIAVGRHVIAPDPGQALTDDDVRMFTLRGATPAKSPGALRLVSLIVAPCSAHDLLNKRCTIYETRPEGCAVFPAYPEQIEGMGTCSFWFEAVDATGAVLRRGGPGSPYPTGPAFHDDESD